MLNEDAIIMVCSSIYVSQNTAKRIVGDTTLERAVSSGKVRANKRDVTKQNGRWDYNLLDLLKICDVRRKRHMKLSLPN